MAGGGVFAYTKPVRDRPRNIRTVARWVCSRRGAGQSIGTRKKARHWWSRCAGGRMASRKPAAARSASMPRSQGRSCPELEISMARYVIIFQYGLWAIFGAFIGLTVWRMPAGVDGAQDSPAPSDAKAEFEAHVKPLLAKYCLECHATDVKKGSLDLERFATLDDVRKNVKPWQAMI